MNKNTELFTNKTDDYSRFRPSYPDVAAVWLKSKVKGEDVLDVGAGTGIFTEVLLKYFSNVSAVEPNAQMREKFRLFLPGVYCSEGTGENTLLPENSVDLITVAQAFHWLDAAQFKLEALRLLRPAGKVAIVWNTSLKNDFNDARNKICQKYCPRFASGRAGKLSAEAGDAFLRKSFFREVEVISFDNPFSMDKETFEGNIRSRSYALSSEEPTYKNFMAELDKVFDFYAQDGIVTEPQETQIYFGCL